MNGNDLLVDAFGRVRESVHDVVEGLTLEQLAFRVDGRANSIVWLLWHLSRVQDDHVAEVAGTPQIWHKEGWVDRFGLPFDASATGFGHTSHDVAAARVDTPELLTGYHDAVYESTVAYLSDLTEADYDRIVDERWDPPVSLGVRLVSVLNDATQHVGQAAFVRGLLA